MKFMWPEMLWLLAVLPLLVALYVWLLRRKKKLALRYANLAMVRSSMSTGQRLRRHVPPLLFLLALATMILAMARPAAVVTLPSAHETVILAMDVSGSMRAGDVKPNRLAAAQAAARDFVNDQPRSTKIGVVAFAAAALVVQHPTQNRQDVLSAIDRLQVQRGTAIGSGIVVALGTIFPNAGITLESVEGAPAWRTNFAQLNRPKKEAHKPVPPGTYSSAAIILLTDGQRTTGPDPVKAAQLAANRGVRVYTVGIGTPEGEIMGFEGWRMRVRLDDETLKTVAGKTRGEYFYAGNAEDLKKVYRTLNARLVFEKKETEVTALFSAIAALLAIVSAMLSLWWFNRIL